MKDLLKIEFYKFRKNSVTLVILLFFCFGFPYLLLPIGNAMKDIPPPFPSTKMFYEFPTVWDFQGYLGSWLVSILLGFLIIHWLTSEVSNRTMRQCIINGQTRKEYFLAKLFSLLFLASLATIIYVLSSLAFGLSNTKDVDLEIIFDNNWAIPRFFVMCLGYLSIAFLIGIWIRKGILSLLLYLAYIIFIEQIIRGIHLYFFKNESVLYYPVNIIEDLMPLPLYKLTNSFNSKDFNFEILIKYEIAFILSLIIVSVCLFSSWMLMKKKDI